MQTYKCILVHPPKMNNWYKPFGDTMYVKYMPLGLLAMADRLDRSGVPTQVIHLGVEYIQDPHADVIEYIRQAQPLVVGVSLHWHPQSYDAIEFARALKSALPGVYVVLGGLTASYYADEIMRSFQFIDGVIRGDGDTPIVSLVQQLQGSAPQLSAVSNLVWRDNGAIVTNELSYVASEDDLNSLDYFRYELLRNHRVYIDILGRSTANYMKLASQKFNTMRRKYPSAVLPIARGCSANCKWCGGSSHAHKLSSGRRRYIFRSHDLVIKDIRQLISYGFGIIHFAHYSHPNESAYYIELFKRIREQGIKIDGYFECSAPPTRELVDAFSETFTNRHISTMCLSRMAPNEEVRRLNVGYYYSNDELYSLLQYMNDKKVPIELTFTLGMPGEKEDDIPKLIEFRKKVLRSFPHIKSNVLLTSQIEPGSFWYLNSDKFGIQTDKKSFKDFYDFASTNNSYYTHLGYWIPGYFKSGAIHDLESFRKKIQEIRCRYFCLLSGNKTGWSANWIGRTKCRALNMMWTLKKVFKR
jgi:radical SAM superfamily enzyme YgiQ (UPF0313 family)